MCEANLSAFCICISIRHLSFLPHWRMTDMPDVGGHRVALSLPSFSELTLAWPVMHGLCESLERPEVGCLPLPRNFMAGDPTTSQMREWQLSPTGMVRE